ncbi:MAG: ABC transporter ATP-binding protein [bacterium]|nr:ABC transporter ATP-binding protein [bacterium]
MKTAICVRQLNKQYGHKQILKDVNMTLEEGQIYGLIGKNGVGKTTLMRILTGLAFKTDGEFSIFGEKKDSELEEQRHRIGTMIETPAFFPYMTAKQNLEYYRIQRGIVDKEMVDEVLETVDLQDTNKKQFKNFSLGMKQRLGLALALLNSPDLLILDEPINGLDPQGIAEFRAVLKRLNVEKQITMLISSHILLELSSIATYYGFMKDGQMAEEISAVELEEKCKAYVQIQVQDPAKIARLMERELTGVQYEVLEQGILKIYGCNDDPSIISDLVVQNGVKLYSLEVKKTQLEDYFLNLIGGRQ